MIPTAIALLLLMLAVTVPVAAVLGLLGIALGWLFSPLPLYLAAGEISWSASTSFIMVAIPFFVMLGEVLLHSGMAERMYIALSCWVSWLPGGLMHSNIGASAMFAATSGSSVATAATVGTVAVNQIERYKYNEPLFLGSLAAGGTLGILIPPSINLIVYGVLTNTSIPKLFLAGIVPGLVLTLLFVVTILVLCILKPSWGGVKNQVDWEQRIRTLPDLLPPVILFATIIGSIYLGWATPTESAALGLIIAFAMTVFKRRMTLEIFKSVLISTMSTTAIIMAIMLGAYFLNLIIAGTGLTTQIGNGIRSLNLDSWQLLLLVIAVYLVLGMFMESLSMMVATVPITAPIMLQAGFDPIWFGIMIVLLVETALITPPVGMNLFVVQSIRGRGEMRDVIIGAAPFVLSLLGMIAIISLWPDVVTWLPAALQG